MRHFRWEGDGALRSKWIEALLEGGSDVGVWVVVITLLLGACTKTEPKMKKDPVRAVTPAIDQTSMYQAVLDAPQLQPHYHIDEEPQRAPLMLSSHTLPPGIQLHKFGQPVKIVDETTLSPNIAYFKFSKPSVTATHDATYATVDFSYPIEGVHGRAVLDLRQGQWILTKVELAEH